VRTIETPGGIPVIVSGVEYALYKKIERKIKKDDLTDREVYIAQQLIDKNILRKKVQNKQTYYIRKRGSI
jgi:hypothetical protein